MAEPASREATAVWALWGLVLAAIAVTYFRLPPADLYHVSHGGLAGAASRVLLETDFPLALVAVALVLVAMDHLPPRAWWVAGPTIALCAVTAWPGVVDEAALDARPVNAIPALGVLGALALTWRARRAGSAFAPHRRYDPARAAVAATAVVAAVPWIAAELGVFGPDAFGMRRAVIEADGAVHVAVHLGHHHGLDGAALVVTAMLLSRVAVRGPRLRTAVVAYVSLLAAYGAGNLAEDLWNEQIVPRGWSDWPFPSVTNPGLTAAWAAVVVAAVIVAVAWRSEAGPRSHAVR